MAPPNPRDLCSRRRDAQHRPNCDFSIFTFFEGCKWTNLYGITKDRIKNRRGNGTNLMLASALFDNLLGTDRIEGDEGGGIRAIKCLPGVRTVLIIDCV